MRSQAGFGVGETLRVDLCKPPDILITFQTCSSVHQKRQERSEGTATRAISADGVIPSAHHHLSLLRAARCRRS